MGSYTEAFEAIFKASQLLPADENWKSSGSAAERNFCSATFPMRFDHNARRNEKWSEKSILSIFLEVVRVLKKIKQL